LPLRFSHEMKHEKPRDDFTARRFMTVAEVAAYFQVHPTTIYNLLRRGKLPAFKIGSDWRFDKDAIDKLMIDRQVKVPS
jgi:excisionase family DNA binding protein